MIDRTLAAPEDDVRLRVMVHAIVEGVQPRRVILFGSRARGDARPDSDYDLVVELNSDWSNFTETYASVASALSPAKDGALVDVWLEAAP